MVRESARKKYSRWCGHHRNADLEWKVADRPARRTPAEDVGMLLEEQRRDEPPDAPTSRSFGGPFCAEDLGRDREYRLSCRTASPVCCSCWWQAEAEPGHDVLDAEICQTQLILESAQVGVLNPCPDDQDPLYYRAACR